MKNSFYLLLILSITFACSAPKEEAENSEEETTTEEESTFAYSSSFEMGDQANQMMVRELIEAYASKDMEKLSSMLADSVYMYFANGGVFKGTREQMMENVEEYVSQYSSIEITHLAAMAVNETTENDEWGLHWIAERRIKEDGTEEMDIFQENFLIEDGKISSMRQFHSKPNEADAPTGDEEPADYTYSGSFEMGDQSLVSLATGLNDAVQNQDIEAISSYFADSVTIVGHDGFYFNSTRDSLITMVTGWMENMREISMDYNAGISVTSTDRNEDWVLLWYEGNYLNSDGEANHSYGHDDYLIEDGKIRVIRGYEMKIADEEESAEAEEVTEEAASIIQ
jgi:hypothetical protein